MFYNGYKNDRLQPPLHRSHTVTAFYINYSEKNNNFLSLGESKIDRSFNIAKKYVTTFRISNWLTDS